MYGNVQINQFDYYPGDAHTDFIGFNEYDFGYNSIYKGGPAQPAPAEQEAAWKTMELPRINRFADLARTHNKRVILGEWGLWQLGDKNHPSGGDNPSYIRNMYDRMTAHDAYRECYFETPADGRSTLWPGGYPVPGSGNPSWGKSGSPYPNASATYRRLFSPAAAPSTVLPVEPPVGIEAHITGKHAFGRSSVMSAVRTRWASSKQPSPATHHAPISTRSAI